MVGGSDRPHSLSVTEVEVDPAEVFAGAEMTLRVGVSCPEGCDVRGGEIQVRGADGAVVGRAELGDDHAGATQLVVTAPVESGTHSWSAVFPAQERGGYRHEEAVVPFSFDVRPHTSAVVAWGIPSAVVAGERFGMRVGIKCSLGCSLADRPFEVYDAEGTRQAFGTVGGEVWPGTNALHFAEVELPAPDAVGYARWEVRVPASEVGLPHEAGSHGFGVTTVAAPECTVTVEAVDRERQTPIKGAHVLLHPFRAVTDERGVAEVRVTKGEYKLFVSGLNYVIYDAPVEVSGDMVTRAELSVEPEPSLDDYY